MCIIAIINGGIALRKTRRLCSLIMVIATLTGGNMMASAVKDNDKAAAPAPRYAHELDAQAYNGTDLGAVYSPSSTTFKVWAPTASGVAVKLYATGSSGEAGAQDLSVTAMTKGEKGVWSVKINGDIKNRYYTYLVTVGGVTRETADIYAKASGVNGNRSMVVNLPETNPQGWEKDRHVLYDDPTDAVVWEVHVKDFSSSEVSGISLRHRGKYLAFTENGTTLADKGSYPTCIEYLKQLGVTHVQLLPVYDYATVNEEETESNEFNWGYDPKNYNVPEGSYSTNPFDGNVRIREFKEMVMALHKAGIGVIMDVVYNHTFTAEGGWFEMTVPGYYYRMKPDGSFSDGSGCGNETASDHLMYRKYMIDSILHWTKEYHIDGFRFDLMGVHDVDTMNAIRSALDTEVVNGKKIIMYGEPWTGGPLSTEAKTAVKANIRSLNDRIGAFNDEFRDAVKGHVFNAHEQGFVQCGGSRGNLKAGIAANTLINVLSNKPSQMVSYVSAHDNFTLYDKLVLSVKNDMSYNVRDEALVEMNKLSAALVLTSQGISFMQAGEEFARTKQGDENSYVSPTSLNQLDWNHVAEYADLVSYYRGLMEVRRHFKPFRDSDTTSAKLMCFSENTPEGTVAYTLENVLTPDKEWKHAALVFNGSKQEQTVMLAAGEGKQLPAEWTVVVNKYEAGLRELATVSGTAVTIPPCSAMVLVDKESFDRLSLQSEDCVVRTEYRDSESGELLSARSYKGTAGSAYTTAENAELLTDYDLDRTEGQTSGHFTKAVQTVTYYYRPFKGAVIDLKVNYLKKADPLFGDEDTVLAPCETLRLREGTDYTAAIRRIEGMVVDLDSFPVNAFGKAGKKPVTVNYYYKKAPSQEAEDTDSVVNVIYIQQDKAVLKTTVLHGKAGEAYQTVNEAFDGLVLSAKTDNTAGVFSDTPAYVIYSYTAEQEHEERNTVLPAVLVLTGAGALAAAAVLFGRYCHNKKRMAG